MVGVVAYMASRRRLAIILRVFREGNDHLDRTLSEDTPFSPRAVGDAHFQFGVVAIWFGA